MSSRIRFSSRLKILSFTYILGGCGHFFSDGILEQTSTSAQNRRFSAKDGKYFPNFIETFFQGSSLFSRMFPTVAEARKNVVLIEVKQLSEGDVPANETNLNWSKDSQFFGYEINSQDHRKILIRGLATNFEKELMIIPANASSNRESFLNGIVSSKIHSYNAGLRWANQSLKYVFMSNGGVGTYNLYLGHLKSEKVQLVAESSGKNGYASWSPDGKEIVFVSSRDGIGNIYLLNVRDNKVSRLTNSHRIDIFPEWSVDGNAILFCGGDAQKHDIFMLTRSTATDQNSQYPGWSEAIKITDSYKDLLRPTLSPDGRFISFYVSDDSLGGQEKHWNIVVIPFSKNILYKDDEIKKRIIARNVVIDLNTGPSWTPDSQKILYVKEDIQNFNPIQAYDLFQGKRYWLKTNTKMNRDLVISPLGVLSFRAQVDAWERVFLALTNQGEQLQSFNTQGERESDVKDAFSSPPIAGVRYEIN